MQVSRLKFYIGLTFAVILLLIVYYSNFFVDRRNVNTKEALVDTYLSALERKDERAILSLIPNDRLAKQEVKAKVALLGGRSIQDRQVCYRELFKPQHQKVTIQCWYVGAKGQREAKFKDVLEIQSGGAPWYQGQGGRWYLLLGKRTGGLPPPTVRQQD